jgi:hypothetical protein
MSLKTLFMAALFAAATSGATVALEDCKLKRVKLEGKFLDLDDRAELSGVALYGDTLILVSNEATRTDEGTKKEDSLQLFDRSEKRKNTFIFRDDEPVFEKDDNACRHADLEGIAVIGDLAYVVGSHSLARAKLKKGASYDENKAAFDKAEMSEPCSRRNSLLELRLSKDGRIAARKSIDLGQLIKQHRVFEPFLNVPSKENGVDIEGIAVTEDEIYIGFRGPVLRDNFVPVLVLNRKEPEAGSEIRYVQLGGRGIRDMARVADGFLIIAGPVGDADFSFKLVHWNGKDMIPGTDRRPTPVSDLCELPRSGNAKAEGIAVVEETSKAYKIIVVYDGKDALIAKSGRVAR